MWESRRDSKKLWEGWEAGFMPSTLCHFHGLLFPRQMLDKPVCRFQCSVPHCHEMLIGTHRLSLVH
jgi:hypothetical protein